MSDIQQNILSKLPEIIFGAEVDDNAAGTENQGDPDGTDTEGANGTDGTGDNLDNDGGEEDGRTKALKAERKLKREAEAEAKRLRAENEALKRKDMEEVDRLKAELGDAQAANTGSTIKLQKLVDGFRTNAVNNAIIEEAKKLKFIDTADALDGVDLADLTVEQDDEDPTIVTIDQKSVTAAVKKLATRKPHFINKGTEDGNATGSQFGGSRRKGEPTSEETLRDMYPNL